MRDPTPQAAHRATPTASSTPRPSAWQNIPACPFRPTLLSPRHWVAEIIYFPAGDRAAARARALGCRTLAGTGMAIYQAVRAFELFTGIAPDRAAMAGHFEAAA